MKKSAFINDLVVVRAEIAFEPFIKTLLDPKLKLSKQSAFHIIALDPGFDFSNIDYPDGIPNHSILYEKSFGEISVSDWSEDYKMFARTKALCAWHHKMPTRRLKDLDMSIKLHVGDPIMTGGVYENGLAIGGSGIEGYKDEIACWTFHNLIVCFAHEFREEYLTKPNSSPIIEFKQEFE